MAGRKQAKAVDKGKTTAQRTSKGRASARASRTASHDAEYTPKSTKSRSTKMASNGVQKTTTRRGPGRGSKKDRWGEEFLTTNSKSPIIDVDLVKLLAHPSAWTCLEEGEKQEILDLLPEHLRPQADPEDPNSTIPPISPGFLRYNNNWRDGVRQFQLDLQQGKYEPEWLNQAAQAMEERAEGNFDKWKEEQFEQFWGQKQKLDRTLAAGASSKIKLETLVEHNCVRVGDKWKYTRGFGKGSNRSARLIVEKEVEIIDRVGSSLTFAIPPGREVFLRDPCHESAELPETTEKETTPPPVKTSPETESNFAITHEPSNTNASHPTDTPSRTGSPTPDEKNEAADDTVVPVPSGSVQAPTNGTTPAQTDGKTLESDSVVQNGAEVVDGDGHTHETEATGDSNTVPDAASAVDQDTPRPHESESLDTNRVSSSTAPNQDAMDIDSSENKPQNETMTGNTAPAPMGPETDGGELSESSETKQIDNTTEESAFADPESSSQPAQPSTTVATSHSAQEPHDSKNEPPKNIILKDVTSPQALEKKILNLDGRVTNPPNGNAWKEFRSYRNNQDIGSIWEIRQEWFSRQTR